MSESLTESGHQIIDISFEQMYHFVGNMLVLESNDGRSLLVLSQSAFTSLTSDHKDKIEQHNTLVPLAINTTQTIGGGSARCMIAEIFLHSAELNSQIKTNGSKQTHQLHRIQGI